jgi:hypothetical protein
MYGNPLLIMAGAPALDAGKRGSHRPSVTALPSDRLTVLKFLARRRQAGGGEGGL